MTPDRFNTLAERTMRHIARSYWCRATGWTTGALALWLAVPWAGNFGWTVAGLMLVASGGCAILAIMAADTALEAKHAAEEICRQIEEEWK